MWKGSIKKLNKTDINFLFFLFSIILVSVSMWMFGASLNTLVSDYFFNYRIMVKDLKITLLEVFIAPINEEIVKFLGYFFIMVFGTRFATTLGFKSRKEFRDNYLFFALLISAGGFGFFEGISHNASFGFLCFYPFVILNMLIHITYSIYPFILGRKFYNFFSCFYQLEYFTFVS